MRLRDANNQLKLIKYFVILHDISPKDIKNLNELF